MFLMGLMIITRSVEQCNAGQCSAWYYFGMVLGVLLMLMAIYVTFKKRD